MVGVLLMNAQSSGSISLANTDPTAQPLIRLSYLDHAFDRRVYSKAVEETMNFATTSALPPVEMLTGPESTSAEDILV